MAFQSHTKTDSKDYQIRNISKLRTKSSSCTPKWPYQKDLPSAVGWVLQLPGIFVGRSPGSLAFMVQEGFIKGRDEMRVNNNWTEHARHVCLLEVKSGISRRHSTSLSKVTVLSEPLEQPGC